MVHFGDTLKKLPVKVVIYAGLKYWNCWETWSIEKTHKKRKKNR